MCKKLAQCFLGPFDIQCIINPVRSSAADVWCQSTVSHTSGNVLVVLSVRFYDRQSIYRIPYTCIPSSSLPHFFPATKLPAFLSSSPPGYTSPHLPAPPSTHTHLTSATSVCQVSLPTLFFTLLVFCSPCPCTNDFSLSFLRKMLEYLLQLYFPVLNCYNILSL